MDDDRDVLCAERGALDVRQVLRALPQVQALRGVRRSAGSRAVRRAVRERSTRVAAVDADTDPPAAHATPGAPIRHVRGDAPLRRHRRVGRRRRAGVREDLHVAVPGRPLRARGVFGRGARVEPAAVALVQRRRQDARVTGRGRDADARGTVEDDAGRRRRLAKARGDGGRRRPGSQAQREGVADVRRATRRARNRDGVERPVPLPPRRVSRRRGARRGRRPQGGRVR
mmetsp:Transcript_12693/g.57287  ORF Transcript_12693/g.57287 Transcript_12693/m.57287 type:complete len:228 (-) Transcript_12693:774-1457(-)